MSVKEIRSVVRGKAGYAMTEEEIKAVPKLNTALAVGSLVTLRKNVRPCQKYNGRYLDSEVYNALVTQGRQIRYIAYNKNTCDLDYAVYINKKIVWLSSGIVKKINRKNMCFSHII